MSIPTPVHGNQLYPWASWTDGKPHTARRGRHFHTTAEVFRRVLITRARRINAAVTTRVQGDRVWFQFGEK